MKSLCVVPCGRRKVWELDPTAGPTAARRVYVGPFAIKCREYAERFYPASWCILSAKYGFLLPNDIVAGPYDVTFKDRKTDPISDERLADQAEKMGLREFDEIVALGGKDYVLVVRRALIGANVRAPLSGLRIGYMQQAIKAATLSGTPL